MEFHHILQSNTSPATFPKNKASSFSTPLTNPIRLDGKWEVAVTNFFYENKVNTFDNDRIIIYKPFESFDHLERPIKFTFNKPTVKTTPEVVNYFQQELTRKLKGILELRYTDNGESKSVKWIVKRSDVFIILCDEFRHRFKLFQDVLTQWDSGCDNYYSLEKEIEFTKDAELSVIVFPFQYNCHHIDIKEAHETIDVPTLLLRYNDRLSESGIRLKLSGGNLRLFKKCAKGIAVIHNRGLHVAMHHKQAGALNISEIGYYWPEFHKSISEKWSVMLFSVDTVIDENGLFPHTFILEPQLFQTRKQAVNYLNEKFKGLDLHFEVNFKEQLQVQIKKENLAIEFDENLCDIFALDVYKFQGKGTLTAGDSFSLNRRINFLYIYSNIGDLIRVGDVEVNLLAIAPVSEKMDLIEKRFLNPLYIPVIHNYISHINIKIYDGAGKLVPFARDSITSIHLHFQQK